MYKADTRAMRERAVWLGHIDYWFAAQVVGVADEVDCLRSVVEYAPHGDDCKSFGGSSRSIYGPCDCWKAEAL